MIVQRSIIIAALELVQENVENTIARQHEPPQQVRSILTTDDEIRRSAGDSIYQVVCETHKVPSGALRGDA